MVRQQRANDCGLAALATVTAHHGRAIDIDGIDIDGVGVALDRHGADLLALSTMARHLGFRTQGCRVSYDAIKDCPLPAIAHVRRWSGGGHFVVVHRWTATHVVIADPAAGIRTVSRRVFCRRASGYLLLVVPSVAQAVDA